MFVGICLLCSSTGTATGEGLFQRVKKTLVSAGLGWEKLASVPTGGGSKEYGWLQDRRSGG